MPKKTKAQIVTKPKMSLMWRPKVITNEVVQKLEHAFVLWMTDKEACIYANVAPRTFYDFCKENEEFSQWKELIKGKVSMAAKANVANEVYKWSVQDSWKWLEARNKEEFDKNREEPKWDFFQNVQIVINYPEEIKHLLKK